MSSGCGGHHAKFLHFDRHMLCHCNPEQSRQLLVNAWHYISVYYSRVWLGYVDSRGLSGRMVTALLANHCRKTCSNCQSGIEIFIIGSALALTGHFPRANFSISTGCFRQVRVLSGLGDIRLVESKALRPPTTSRLHCKMSMLTTKSVMTLCGCCSHWPPTLSSP